jgi:hypothetical protein
MIYRPQDQYLQRAKEQYLKVLRLDPAHEGAKENLNVAKHELQQHQGAQEGQAARSEL